MKTYDIFWLLIIWTALAVFATGCTEKDDIPAEKSMPVEVTCSLQVASFGGGQSTRGTELTPEEAVIQDLTVIQFDGEDDDAPTMIVRTFQKPSSLTGLKVGLMQPQDANKKQTLYFIANTGETYDYFNGTLGAFKATTVSLSEMGGNILMTGCSQTVIRTETPVNATLTSRLAKIVLNMNLVNLPAGSKLEPLWLQLRSVPVVACPVAPADGVNYPGASDHLYADLQPVVNNIENSYTWYVPENRRGKSSSSVSEPKDKNNHKPDNFCTCIYLEANYYPNAGDQTQDAKRVYFTLYPGADNLNDFNIVGNQPYKVTLNITTIPDDNSDSRLRVEPIPKSLPGANCYMVKPNSFLTFNPHSEPGIAVDNTISFFDRVGTGVDGDCNIESVGLVWETDPGLIRAIYHLKANGEFRIQTADMKGNALIAAYDKDRKILWSWHIWVTDYVLDGVGDEMSETSAEVPDGHVYKWSNQIWMDRGIGAKKPGLGIDAFGMCYQWGRKDPFLPAIQNTESDSNTPAEDAASTAQTVPMFNADGERIYVGGQEITVAKDFETPMNNPTMFYRNTSGLWYGSTAITNLWQDSQKTCFDPCPAGWRVVPSGVISNFTTGNVTRTFNSTVSSMNSNGMTCNAVNGLRWPYGGYRDVLTGKAKGPGHQGLCWTSAGSSSQGRVYGGRKESIDTAPRAQSDGQSVRCVKIKK